MLFSRGAPVDVEHLLLTLSDSNSSPAVAPLDLSSIKDGLFGRDARAGGARTLLDRLKAYNLTQKS